MKKLFLIILSLGLFSCGDFLEPKSETLFIPRDVNSLKEMLLGEGYPRIGVWGSTLNPGLQFLDDDVCCTSKLGTMYASDESKMLGYQALYSWQPDMFERLKDASMYKEIWESHYRYILGANAALDYVDGVEGTNEEKAEVKAEALTLRAFYFFNLVNVFGSPYNYNKGALGIPLKLTSGMEDKDISRNTVEEVYEQIIADLEEAERFYQSIPEERQFIYNRRANFPLMQLLRSRVSLYMENWKDAAKYAKRVIDDWDFALLDLNTLPATTAAAGVYPIVSETSSECIWAFGAADYDIIPYINISITEPVTYTSYKIFNASDALIKGFLPGDLRRKWYVARETKDTNLFLSHGKILRTSYGSIESNQVAQTFRLSEAYLNLAEAAAMDKDEETALWALDELRKKRFMPGYEEITSKGVDLIDKIRQERRLELCFEFHRWNDLRRYGMPSFSRIWQAGKEQKLVYTLEEQDPAYTLPIPKVVMDENKTLKQNDLASPR